MKLIHFLVKTATLYFLKVFNEGYVDGLENLPEKNFLLACNHVSYFDPPFIGGCVPFPMHYLARKTLFKTPMMDWVLSRCNTIPVDQTKPDLAGLRKVMNILQSGEPLVLFPEGQRSYDGKLLPAEPGVGFLVAKTKVDVVPARLFGMHEAWPRDGKIKMFVPTQLVIGKIIKYEDFNVNGSKDYQRVGNQIMDAIKAIQPIS